MRALCVGGGAVSGISIDQASLRLTLSRLSAVGTRVAPEAARLAINDVAFSIFFQNKKLIEKSFDDPVPFTKNAFFVQKATTSNPVAIIQRKTIAGQRNYLETQSDGGVRPQTGLEKLLEKRLKYEGVIRAVLPTSHTRKDRRGNISRSLVTRILASAGSGGSASGGRRGGKYFVAQPGDALSPGVYEERAREIRKVLAFTDVAPRYDDNFPMVDAARKVAAKEFEPAYERAFKTALART